MPHDKSHQLVSDIADDFESKYYSFFPEMALFWGKENIRQNTFSQHNIAAIKKWEENENNWLMRLKQIDESTLIGSPLHTTYHLLKEILENEQGARICQEHLWAVNPQIGWHIALGTLADKQPVTTEQDKQDLLDRWQGVMQISKDEIDNLKQGLATNYSAPKSAVQRVITQLDMMLDTPINESPFYVMGKNANDSVFAEKVAKLITQKINPALALYRDFLKNDYLPQARSTIGLSALPNGEACYAAKLKKATTLSIAPDAVFQLGETQLSRVSHEVSDIGAQYFGTQEPKSIFQQAKEQSRKSFINEQAILSYNEKALDKANSVIPKWFCDMPATPCQIKPYPEHRAKTGAPGEYHPGHPAHQKPGTFLINTYQPQEKSRVDIEATLYHELIPGHHFQIALAQENKNHHPVNQILLNSGFAEGWALYSERLADEMGLYEDHISKLGMLSNEALRAARMMVDPGIHVFGWTRQEAIDFLQEFTAMDPNIISAEVDRYIMLPGQATSYMLGKLEIEKLRTLAESRLKENFDIRQFHKQVLQNGGITLPMLQANLLSWVETVSLNGKQEGQA